MLPLMPAIITCLALVLYMVLSFNVGRARGKYGIKAPATTGHELFDRVYRTQMNTLEQLVFFIPSLWLFFAFVPMPIVGPLGTLLGFAWLVGRILYARNYVNPEKSRTAGFVISVFSASLLLLGAILGLLALIILR
jgi:glutathione S-transferase